MTTYILDTETTGLIEQHMTEAAYSIVDMNDGKVNVLQKPRAKRINLLKQLSFIMVRKALLDNLKYFQPHAYR